MAAEITGFARILAESSTGDQSLLIQSVPTGLLDGTTAAARVRLDVPDSTPAQTKNPTPTTGRSVLGLVNKAVQANGYVIVQVKNNAAGTLDTVGGATATTADIGIIVNDLTKPEGSANKYQVGHLSIGPATPSGPYQRNTARVADDPVGSTTKFVDFAGWQCPTGQAWLVHGEMNMYWFST